MRPGSRFGGPRRWLFCGPQPGRYSALDHFQLQRSCTYPFSQLSSARLLCLYIASNRLFKQFRVGFSRRIVKDFHAMDRNRNRSFTFWAAWVWASFCMKNISQSYFSFEQRTRVGLYDPRTILYEMVWNDVLHSHLLFQVNATVNIVSLDIWVQLKISWQR